MNSIKCLYLFNILFFGFTISNIYAIKYSEYNSNPPCHFFDSVDITNGRKQNGGSYLYDGVLYPKNMIGVYDYQIINGTERVSVEPHLRGCICELKSCVRMCCQKGYVYLQDAKTCQKPRTNISNSVEVYDKSGTYRKVDIETLFGFVYGIPCMNAYFMEPQNYEEDKWNLYEDGRIYRFFDKTYLTKDQYCLSPTLENINQTEMFINPLVCFQIQEDTKGFIYGLAMYLSIPFIIVTVVIYMAITELRNLHGKCLCCYLTSLVLGYIFLGYMLLVGGIPTTDSRCHLFGYSTYFFFMASFLWLNIISFDLWWNFRGITSIDRHKEMKRFIIYSIYSWGLALTFLVMIIGIQNSGLSEDLKPGIGGGDNCFLNVNTWMQMFYFYGQMLVIITLNTIMFGMTFYKIYQVNKEMRRVMKKGDSQKSYNKEKDKVKLFLRLFIVMGVTWSMEFISWLGSSYEILFYATDICNAVQGLIIFILFVCRKRVRRLIVNKYYTMRGLRPKHGYGHTNTATKTSEMGATSYVGRRNTDADDKAASVAESLKMVEFQKENKKNVIEKREDSDESA